MSVMCASSVLSTRAAAPVAAAKARRSVALNAATAAAKTTTSSGAGVAVEHPPRVTLARTTTTVAAAITAAVTAAPQAASAASAAAATAVFEVADIAGKDVFATSGLGPALCVVGTVFIGYTLFTGYATIKRLKEELTAEGYDVVGLYQSNAVDPQLETARFQRLSLPLDPT
jgi:hypothetical protein